MAMTDTDILHRLSSEGRALVDSAFLRRDRETIAVDETGRDPLGRTVALQPFKALVDECLRETEPLKPALDAWLAPRLHKALPLYRSEAADPAVWHYLTVVVRPHIVRHRFAPMHTSMISRERFLGSIKRNMLARLWWGAELTVVDEDYRLTERLFTMHAGQDFYENVFGRRFSYYGPAMRACLSVIGGEGKDVLQTVGKSISQVLTTLVLEDMTQAELEELIARIVDEKRTAASA